MRLSIGAHQLQFHCIWTPWTCEVPWRRLNLQSGPNLMV